MNATVVLCDYAEERQGKLYIMGGGWDAALADTPLPMALAIVLHVPWDETNRPFDLRVDLVDEDGQPAEFNGEPVHFQGKMETGRPPGTKHGSVINVPLAMRMPLIQLPAGIYTFRVTMNGEAIASVPFRMLPKPT